MYESIPHLEHRIKRLESDLKDCRDPKVLSRWPNLGSSVLIAETEKRLAEAKRQLKELQ